MIDAAPASARAEALLTATNEFLRSDDLQVLARALVAASVSMFAPTKAAVMLRDRDGGRRVMATFDGAPAAAETAGMRPRSELAVRLLEMALDGTELSTDDPDAEPFSAQVRSYGAVSGLAVPIPTTAGSIGVLILLFGAEGPLDSGLRETARSLAAQAGLAIELLETRRDLHRQTSLSSALLEVSQHLATLTDPDDVPATLVRAIRAATGASIALVARWCEPEARIEFTAIEGMTREEARALRDLETVAADFGMVQGGLLGRSAVLVPPFDPADLPLEFVGWLGITAVAGAPIIADGRTWGFLVVATREGDPGIVENGAELLAGFASLTATALGRTTAIAQLEQNRELLESTVAERTRELTSVVEELRHASHAKTEFLSNVSHELRTPLTSILGFTDLLLHGLEGPLTAAQHEDLRTIEISGGRLLQLIDELIDVSRIESDEVELRIGPVLLEPFLEGVVSEVRPRAAQKSISLDLELTDPPPVIDVDRIRLAAILASLLSNALKFTPPGGSIRVAVGPQEDGSVAIRVEDSGIGIASEELDRIFEKFHRLAGPEVPGTGLGLAIARDYARLHGGDVTVASEPGRGSRFTVRLPVGPAPGTDV